MIRALLYRLLIISAHLQRHGIRLLIAIGRFNARAAAFGADPPAPFDSTNLPLLCLSFVALLHPPPPSSFSSRFLLDGRSIAALRSPSLETHYNYLRWRPRANVFPNELPDATRGGREISRDSRHSRALLA